MIKTYHIIYNFDLIFPEINLNSLSLTMLTNEIKYFKPLLHNNSAHPPSAGPGIYPVQTRYGCWCRDSSRDQTIRSRCGGFIRETGPCVQQGQLLNTIATPVGNDIKFEYIFVFSGQFNIQNVTLIPFLLGGSHQTGHGPYYTDNPWPPHNGRLNGTWMDNQRPHVSRFHPKMMYPVGSLLCFVAVWYNTVDRFYGFMSYTAVLEWQYNGLAPDRRQAITWANADQVNRRIYAALLGGN